MKDPPLRPVERLDQQIRVHTIAGVARFVNSSRQGPLERPSTLPWKVR